MRYSRFGCGAIAVLVLAAGAAQGGPLNRRVVAADARWVLHVDVEAIAASSCWRLLDERKADLRRARLDELRKLEAELGVDPLELVRGVTLYGPSAEDPVAIVEAGPKLDAVIEQLREKLDGYEVREMEGGVLHSWVKADEEQYAFVAMTREGERTVVLAKERPRLDAAVDVVLGRAGHLSDTEILGDPGVGSFIYLSVADFEALKLPGQAAQVVHSARAVTIEVGERSGELFGSAQVTSASEEDAANITAIVQGGLAAVRMVAAREPDARCALDIVKPLKLDRSGATISARWAMEAGRFVDLLVSLSEDAHDEDPAGAARDAKEKKDR